jgi:glycosyltransferase involved in cell wall biosynthesis
LRRPLNILFLTPYLPSPPGFGGARRLHGLMTGLARSHTISVLSLVNAAENHEASIRATREYCREVVTVPNSAFALSRRGKRALQLRSLVSRRSFEWLTHVRPEASAQLRALLAGQRFDVVNVEFSHMAPYREGLPRGRGAPLFVLDEHNIEYEILRRTAASESGTVRKVYNGVNWRKLRAEELAAWRSFDACTVTSAHDRDLLLRDLPATRAVIVPNAVDLDYFRARPEAPPAEPLSIIFFGAINYFPNADGLAYFLDEIFPRVRARVPGARLKVVGHTPEHLFARANDFVEMKGFVPDVRVELERAASVIAPLRLGGGTRLKILEAMAMSKPVVSTPQGAEGLDVTDGREVLLANSPAAFADQLVRVLQDAALAQRLGSEARGLVERRYSWSASVAGLEKLYDDLGAGTRAQGA